MYQKVSTDLNFTNREKKILQFWKDNDIFKKYLKHRNDGPLYTFFEGPPTANGKPHIGHVLTRVVKDIIPRYRTMKGYNVLRKAGWDTHGLPVELEVEKQLGINGKPQIEDYGVEPFIKACKQSVWKYKKEWEDISNRVGFWVDMENPYVTYDNEYIESVWWALKIIWDKDLLYKGHRVVPYCPRCGTSLSSHELAQGYKDVTDKSVFVKFPLKKEKGVFFLAWTTTPWTLPSNVALVVNPKAVYAKVAYENEIFILADKLVPELFKDSYEILSHVLGSELVGEQYLPLFDFAEVSQKAHYVVADNFVTLNEGSGIVHCAPAFGDDDSKVGKDNDLPFVQLVDEQGNFVESVIPWKGMFVKDADPLIIENLRARNLIYSVTDYLHSYPFCWRCDTPLLYYARSAWFIKMSALRENLIKNNKMINWLPENIRDGRFGNFLENVVDWSLSRERYWGTPLPIWECECGHAHLAGSIAEIISMGGDMKPDLDLHKPYIDQVFLDCPKCKAHKMKRVPEVIDCWFDSGSMPFAQWHYPFENEDKFLSHFPAEFISEAIDQTRGWFYTLLAISTLLFDKPSFKNCIVLGHVQDKDGQKMSKHKGNVLDPWAVLENQGADATRWYFYSASAPWLPSRFYEEAVNEIQRKFMGTLWNTYAFYVLYADIDGFNPKNYTIDHNNLPVMDKWILSKLNSLIAFVDRHLDEYLLTEPARAINEFVDELSNWYVRRCRNRFWGSGLQDDKINAFLTLYTVLESLVRILAPFVPFITEEIYNNIVRAIDENAPESVHFCDFPSANIELIDVELEKNMDAALKLVVLGRSCRNLANFKVRQPLSAMYVNGSYKLPVEFDALIADELNIKKVIYTETPDDFISYRIKPQLKLLGPKYGKILPQIAERLKNIDTAKAVAKLKNGQPFTLDVENIKIELSLDELIIETEHKDGFVVDTNRDITVALDINLTEQLVEEGIVRELTSKIQTMRKEAGFEVCDHINVFYEDNPAISKIIEKNAAIIAEDVLALKLIAGNSDGYTKIWDINGINAIITIVKVP